MHASLTFGPPHGDRCREEMLLWCDKVRGCWGAGAVGHVLKTGGHRAAVQNSLLKNHTFVLESNFQHTWNPPLYITLYIYIYKYLVIKAPK